MKFNASVLTFGLVILVLNLVLINASSIVENDSSISSDLSVNPSSMADNKVRVNRQTHCGVRTFKLLMLICTNELKYPVERQNKKDNNDQLLNYEPYNKRSSTQQTDLLNDDQQFNLKRLVDFNSFQDSISDVHVHNNPNYHRMKRSLIRDCCHRSCTLKELENMC